MMGLPLPVSIIYSGRCIVDFVAPKGLDPVAPVICPQYKEDGCCSWQQNYALYQNLRTLVDRSEFQAAGAGGSVSILNSQGLCWTGFIVSALDRLIY